MLLAKLTFGNICNKTKVFEAPQPPILGEPGIKVPRGNKSVASSGFPLSKGDGRGIQGGFRGLSAPEIYYAIFRHQHPLSSGMLRKCDSADVTHLK